MYLSFSTPPFRLLPDRRSNLFVFFVTSVIGSFLFTPARKAQLTLLVLLILLDVLIFFFLHSHDQDILRKWILVATGVLAVTASNLGLRTNEPSEE